MSLYPAESYDQDSDRGHGSHAEKAATIEQRVGTKYDTYFDDITQPLQTGVHRCELTDAHLVASLFLFLVTVGDKEKMRPPHVAVRFLNKR